ncbi:hypothetical protein TKK_0018345 [Trichogramma kaykai]|uniref:phospholipase A1 n=1 Tax=Trichogramma kaykai TaxID=54128 RepID=A0ABD2VYQ9_9HYME
MLTNRRQSAIRVIIILTLAIVQTSSLECSRSDWHPVSWWEWFTNSKHKDTVVGVRIIHKNEQLVFRDVDHIDIEKVDFNTSARTTILIHGLVPQFVVHKMNELKSKLLQWDDRMNIIEVDWSEGSNNLLYYENAVENTKHVAKQMSKFLARLFGLGHDSTSENSIGIIHCIGHSLGAHACGQMGRQVKKQYHFEIPRVTALDPASPCFTANFPLRLRRDDAKLVDVIHTDGSTEDHVAFGLFEPVGTVDFYVNGGLTQPACKGILLKDPEVGHKLKKSQYLQIMLRALIHGAICNHRLAFDMFIESIGQDVTDECNFLGHPWEVEEVSEVPELPGCRELECPEMGMNTEKFQFQPDTVNTYYVKTNDKSPFCQT